MGLVLAHCWFDRESNCRKIYRDCLL